MRKSTIITQTFYRVTDKNREKVKPLIEESTKDNEEQLKRLGSKIISTELVEKYDNGKSVILLLYVIYEE